MLYFLRLKPTPLAGLGLFTHRVVQFEVHVERIMENDFTSSLLVFIYSLTFKDTLGRTISFNSVSGEWIVRASGGVGRRSPA